MQTIKFPQDVLINEIKINRIKYLTFKYISYNLYLRIPAGLTYIRYEGNKFLLQYKKSNSEIKYFNNMFNNVVHTMASFKYKSIVLNGIGLKVKYIYEKNLLELKLGFSHIVRMSLPKYITRVIIFRNTIAFASYDLIALGNFLTLIKSLKKLNAYKGFGISYKKEKIVLKKN